MNCWTAEAISTYAMASMEAMWKIGNANPMVGTPSLAARSAYGIDLRNLAEIIRHSMPVVPAPKAHDAK